MTHVICWLLIHSTTGKLDNREYKQFKGRVVKESGDSLMVNFSLDFKKRYVNIEVNPVVQLVNENECIYER